MLTMLRTALTWGAYVTGLLCSLFAYLYLRCEYNTTTRSECEGADLC